MCGEQQHGKIRHGVHVGSPPRVRGTVKFRNSQFRDARITPACAGNRRYGLADKVLNEDHPRVCGEQSMQDDKKDCGGGSPPRVRGTAEVNTDEERATGITPACAGNSSALMLYEVFLKDHPRVCGEQKHIPCSDSYIRGSPPRVRGTAMQILGKSAQERITPACAGNS